MQTADGLVRFLRPSSGFLLRLVELGVLDGDACPPRQFLSEVHVGCRVWNVMRCAHQGYCSQSFAVSNQRHHDHRLDAQRLQQIEVLFVARGLPVHVYRDVRVQLRLPAFGHPQHRMVLAG